MVFALHVVAYARAVQAAMLWTCRRPSLSTPRTEPHVPLWHWRGKRVGKIWSGAPGVGAIPVLYRGRNGPQELSRDSVWNPLPLGMGRFKITSRIDRTSAQVLPRCGLQNGLVVLPTLELWSSVARS